jgi:hypothetical protein
LANVGIILSHVETQQNGQSAAAHNTTVKLPFHLPPVRKSKFRNHDGRNEQNPSEDKEPILRILHEAGFDDIDEETMKMLPTWTEVTTLYGDHPRIYGLDQCKVFQSMSEPAEHFLGVAGTFNSGTNLMAELLIHNCEMTARMEKYGEENKGIRWQVPWGKHAPAGDDHFRQTHKAKEDASIFANNILPAVTIRDPYAWMQSMCRHQYEAFWSHDKDEHCPNLIPNAKDKALFPILRKKKVVPLEVHYPEFVRQHDSLAHFWNDWYNEYAKATFPRVIVRFEDLIFHAKEVTMAVCECAGGEMKEQDFMYIVDSAKKGLGAHGKQSQRTSFIEAIIRYGKDKGRLSGMSPEDIEFARKSLDRDLVEFFGYLDPPQDTR